MAASYGKVGEVPRLRLAVALLIPPPVDREVDGLRRALGSGALARIPPHVTVVPPVNVDEGALDEVLGLLRQGAARTPALRLELGPTATFWPDNRVVYLAVGGDVTQAESLRQAMMAGPLASRAHGRRPFVAHVTLTARAPAPAIPWIVESLGAFREEVVVERVHLLRERPGQIWDPIADASLSPPAVVGRGGLEVELGRSDRADPAVAAWSQREWAAFDQATYGPDWAPDQPFAITARSDGEVVGLAEGLMRGDTCLLERMIVGRASQDRGVGTKLLAAVESAAAESGCSVCVVRAEAGSRAASFYRGRGWVERLSLPSWRWGRDFVLIERRLH